MRRRLGWGALAACASVWAACAVGCGYQVVGAQARAPMAVTVASAAAEPGLPLLVRRALDLHSGRVGLALVDARGADDEGLSVLLDQPQTRALVIARASQAVAAATAYQVTLRAVARCGEAQADLSAAADYRDLSSPLSTDDARRDAISRAANDLGEQVSAWALAACGQAAPPLDDLGSRDAAP